MIHKVNIAEKFNLIEEFWSPRIAGELNDSFIKIAKLKGEFIWHHHEDEDEMFLVVHGKLIIRLRDRDIKLREGEFVIIPKRVEHMPVADDEVHVILLKPKSIINTGNLQDEHTVIDQWI